LLQSPSRLPELWTTNWWAGKEEAGDPGLYRPLTMRPSSRRERCTARGRSDEAEGLRRRARELEWAAGGSAPPR
jgi:hypothetical protein